MIKVNLLKPEQKDISSSDLSTTTDFAEPREEKVNVPAAIVVAVLTVGVIGFLYFSQQSELEKQKKTLQDKQAEHKKLQTKLKSIKRLKRTKAALLQRIATIQELKKKQKQPVYMMMEISKALPERVWITRLNIKGDRIFLRGVALSQNLIASFTKNIESSDYFSGLKFGGFTKKSKKGIEQFDFRFSVKFNPANIKGV